MARNRRRASGAPRSNPSTRTSIPPSEDREDHMTREEGQTAESTLRPEDVQAVTTIEEGAGDHEGFPTGEGADDVAGSRTTVPLHLDGLTLARGGQEGDVGRPADAEAEEEAAAGTAPPSTHSTGSNATGGVATSSSPSLYTQENDSSAAGTPRLAATAMVPGLAWDSTRPEVDVFASTVGPRVMRPSSLRLDHSKRHGRTGKLVSVGRAADSCSYLKRDLKGNSSSPKLQRSFLLSSYPVLLSSDEEVSSPATSGRTSQSQQQQHPESAPDRPSELASTASPVASRNDVTGHGGGGPHVMSGLGSRRSSFWSYSSDGGETDHLFPSALRSVDGEGEEGVNGEGGSPHVTGRERGVFALFGTLERVDRFAEFAALFQKSSTLLEPFVRAVVEADQLLPLEFDLVHFLSSPSSTRPEACFFHTPIIRWPLQTLYQSCCFLVAAKKHGYAKLFNAIEKTGAVMASGKGIFAALAVAMSPDEDQLTTNVILAFKASFHAGLAHCPIEEKVQRHLEKAYQRSCSILLVNVPIMTLSMLVDEVNRVWLDEKKGIRQGPGFYIPIGDVNLSRIINHRSAVVCGHPLDLQRLDILLVRYSSATGVKIHKEYMPTLCPEGSPMYNSLQYRRMLQQWLDAGFFVSSSDIHLKLLSPVDGSVWNEETDGVIVRLAEAASIRPHDLTYSLRHLEKGDVLLDFSSDTLTLGELIRWGAKGRFSVLSEPSGRLAASSLPPPHRSGQPSVQTSTLEKCATINKVLRSLKWGGKPPGRCCTVVELQTRFADLHLLLGMREAMQEPPSGLALEEDAGSAAVAMAASAPVLEGGDVTATPAASPGGGGRDPVGRSPFTSSVATAGSRSIGSCPNVGEEVEARRRQDAATVGGGGWSPSFVEHAFFNSFGSFSDCSVHVSRGKRNSPLRTGSGSLGSVKPSRFSLMRLGRGGSPVGDGGGRCSLVDTRKETVVLPNEQWSAVMNVYTVSPLIAYYEWQFRCVLTRGAVEFIRALGQEAGIPFPPYTLLMCPTVFDLLELWDGYEFLDRLR